MTSWLRPAGAALGLAMLYGCAGPPQIGPIRSGESVAIVVVAAQEDGVTPIRNLALGSGISTGASSGAVVGGLWGLACGPFAILCIPLTAMAGSISGLGLGAAVGAGGALSDEKAAQLRARLERVRQAHDLLAELRRNLTERAGRYWSLGADPAAAQINVELQDLQLTSTREEQIGLILRVRVSLRAGAGSAPPTPTKEKTYEYIGPVSSLAVWLDERSDFLDTTLSSAAQQLAAQIVSELAPS